MVRMTELRSPMFYAEFEPEPELKPWIAAFWQFSVEPEVGVPPGPADLARIIDQVPRDNAKFIIHAAYENPRPSEYVAENANIPLINPNSFKSTFMSKGTEKSAIAGILEFVT